MAFKSHHLHQDLLCPKDTDEVTAVILGDDHVIDPIKCINRVMISKNHSSGYKLFLFVQPETNSDYGDEYAVIASLLAHKKFLK